MRVKLQGETLQKGDHVVHQLRVFFVIELVTYQVRKKRMAKDVELLLLFRYVLNENRGSLYNLDVQVSVVEIEKRAYLLEYVTLNKVFKVVEAVLL